MFYLNPQVTVLVNTMNERPDWLVRSLDSHIANNGVNKQIIVSTMLHDNNFNLLMEYKRKGLIELYFCDPSAHPGKSPEGAYYQINAALHLVRGEWFYYFSSNDVVDKMKMKNEIKACVDAKKRVCYSAFTVMDGTMEKMLGDRTFRTTYNYAAHIRGNYISDASLVHRSLLKKYAPFRSDLFGNFAHWDFWMRIYEGEGDVFVYNPHSSFLYRQNKDSMHNERMRSPAKQVIADEQLFRLREFNNRKKVK